MVSLIGSSELARRESPVNLDSAKSRMTLPVMGRAGGGRIANRQRDFGATRRYLFVTLLFSGKLGQLDRAQGSRGAVGGESQRLRQINFDANTDPFVGVVDIDN